jgi:hypothetical protein
MNKKLTTILVCLSTVTIVPNLSADIRKVDHKTYSIENNNLGRTLTIKKGKLATEHIDNHKAGKKLIPLASDEFRMRLSKGTQFLGTDFTLTSADFKVSDVETSSKTGLDTLTYTLRNAKHGITVAVVFYF